MPDEKDEFANKIKNHIILWYDVKFSQHISTQLQK